MGSSALQRANEFSKGAGKSSSFGKTQQNTINNYVIAAENIPKSAAQSIFHSENGRIWILQFLKIETTDLEHTGTGTFCF